MTTNDGGLKSTVLRGMVKAATVAAVLAFGAGVWAQEPTGQPAEGQPAEAQPDAAGREALQAKVLEVTGNVRRAPAGVVQGDPQWAAVVVSEMLPSGTQIATGFRSSVVLGFGEDTVVQVRKASLCSIDDYYKSATQKTVALGLGYGTIRGGSTEGELRTEVVVDSTVATLAKRGTEGWEIEIEPTTGFFRGSVARLGLIEMIQKLTGQSRLVRANQYVNTESIRRMWISQTVFDRAVRFYDGASVSESESKFASENTGGASVVSPDASEANQVTKRLDPGFVTSLQAAQASNQTTPQFAPPLFRLRPEGDFGFPPTLSNLLNEVIGGGAKSRVETRREQFMFRGERSHRSR
ncbi:MAG: hypothetical protein HOP29_19885 [Phycisphaerales bacterium]|nr:hypothetical protein [Phycisphaerales bacterium]